MPGIVPHGPEGFLLRVLDGAEVLPSVLQPSPQVPHGLVLGA